MEVSDSKQALLASLGAVHVKLSAEPSADASSIKCVAGKVRGSQLCIAHNVQRSASGGLKFFGTVPSEVSDGHAVRLEPTASPFKSDGCSEVIEDTVHLFQTGEAADALSLYLGEMLPIYHTMLQTPPLLRSSRLVAVSSTEDSGLCT